MKRDYNRVEAIVVRENLRYPWYTVNCDMKLLELMDSNNKCVRTNTYDSLGRIITTNFCEKKRYEFEYHDNGEITVHNINTESGEEHWKRYDSEGHIISYRDHIGYEEHYTYHNGQRVITGIFDNVLR